MNEVIQQILFDDYARALIPAALSYGAVTVAVGVDLITGLRKARRNGERIHSTGLKRSCRKMADYVLPMIGLSMVDLIGVKFIGLPVLTMVYGMFCVICEVKSIMERSWEKRDMRRMIDVARVMSHHDMAQVLRRAIELIELEDKKVEGANDANDQ